MFGGKLAPYIFNLFAEALHWIIKNHIPAALHHYLDNFLPIFKPSMTIERANAAVIWIEALAEELSLSFQPAKTIQPTTCLEFLGLELDSSAMEARLPQEKLEFLQIYLRNWQARSRCMLKEVQELAGFLQFCAQVVPHGRTFIRGIINFSMKFSNEFTIKHIPAYARLDIHWWSMYAHSWNGMQLLEPQNPTLHIYMDASGTKGLGGIFGDEWFSTKCPRHFCSRDIQFKEIYAVLHAILRWGHLWTGHHVIFHMDNYAVVSALCSGSMQNPQVMNVLRFIVMLAAWLGFSYNSSWLASSDNSLADAAFRFDYAHLFSMAPYMKRKPCMPSPQLCGIKTMLTCPPAQLFSYGTASPPRPGQLIGQDRNCSMISSPCTHSSEMLMAPSSLQHKSSLSNWLPGSGGSNGFSPRLSSP